MAHARGLHVQVALLHLLDVLRGDVELARDHGDLVRREPGEALLVLPEVEEQLPLRLGGRDLHHAPVLDDVLMDAGLDPVDGEGDEAHAHPRIKALHRLHEADVPLLYEVGKRKPVAEVAPRDMDDEPELRDDELLRRLDVPGLLVVLSKRLLLLRGEDGDAVDCPYVGVKARLPDGRQRPAAGHHQAGMICSAFAFHLRNYSGSTLRLT